MSYRRLNRNVLTGPGGMKRSAAIFSPNTTAKNAIANSVFIASAVTQAIEAILP